MALHDELVDVTTLILGLRSEAQASRAWPSILGQLVRISDAVRRRGPARRRSPRIDAAADWLHRSLRDAPIAEDLRVEAEVLIGRIKAMVGPVMVKHNLLTREDRHGRGRQCRSERA